MRIACFNVLADCYAYGHVPPSVNAPLPAFLSWDSRKQLLTEVLTSCDADLLFLQEIDHLDDFYSPLLTNLEYSLKYVSRTGSKQDGCLLAFKNDYELVGYEEVQFDDIASYLSSDTQRSNVQRFNVAQIALFQHKRDCLPFVWSVILSSHPSFTCSPIFIPFWFVLICISIPPFLLFFRRLIV